MTSLNPAFSWLLSLILAAFEWLKQGIIWPVPVPLKRRFQRLGSDDLAASNVLWVNLKLPKELRFKVKEAIELQLPALSPLPEYQIYFAHSPPRSLNEDEIETRIAIAKREHCTDLPKAAIDPLSGQRVVFRNRDISTIRMLLQHRATFTIASIASALMAAEIYLQRVEHLYDKEQSLIAQSVRQARQQLNQLNMLPKQPGIVPAVHVRRLTSLPSNDVVLTSLTLEEGRFSGFVRRGAESKVEAVLGAVSLSDSPYPEWRYFVAHEVPS